MRKFVVTGGAGFIGSHIVQRLVERGDQVAVVDNFCTGHLENLKDVVDQIEIIEGDICCQQTMANALNGVHGVFHQAALASVPLSIEQPTEVNDACVNGTLNVLNQARLCGVKRVVYAASSSCYGDQTFRAIRETDLPKPMTPYAVAKLAGEYYCQAFASCYEIETVALRYFNVFGPRQDPDSPYSAVIPIFITRLLSGKSPVVYGDGKQSRDFTYVSNVVDGNLLAMDAPNASGKTYNMADGKSTDLLTLIAHLARLLGVETSIQFEAARIGDIKDSMADITAAVKDLGYAPKVSFVEGLEKSIDYYKSVFTVNA